MQFYKSIFYKTKHVVPVIFGLAFAFMMANTPVFADDETETPPTPSGYVCDPAQREYISCNEGYLMDRTGPGNKCIQCGAGYYIDGNLCKNCKTETSGQYPSSNNGDNTGITSCYNDCTYKDNYNNDVNYHYGDNKEVPVGCWNEDWCKKTDDDKYYVWDNGTCRTCTDGDNGEYYTIENGEEKCNKCTGIGQYTHSKTYPNNIGITSCQKQCVAATNLPNATERPYTTYIDYDPTGATFCEFIRTYETGYYPELATSIEAKQCGGTLYYKKTSDGSLTKINQPISVKYTAGTSITFNRYYYKDQNNQNQDLDATQGSLVCINYSNWTLKLGTDGDSNNAFFSTSCTAKTCCLTESDYNNTASATNGKTIATVTSGNGTYAGNTHIFTNTVNEFNANELYATVTLNDCSQGHYCTVLYQYDCPYGLTTGGTKASAHTQCNVLPSSYTFNYTKPDNQNGTYELGANTNVAMSNSVQQLGFFTGYSATDPCAH